MKKLIVLSVMMLSLFGCSDSKPSAANKITLTPNKGEVVEITLDEFFDKIEKKESFVVIMSQTHCSSCINFFLQSDAYTKKFGLTLYDVKLDLEKRQPAEVLELLDKHISDFSATPALYLMIDGVEEDSLNVKDETVTLESYQAFLERNSSVFSK